MAITVEFSPSVAEAVGKYAERRRKRLERNFNRGLKELTAGGHESAKALYESKQTIRIVCEAGEEGKKILEENNTEFPKDASAMAGAGPALTFGDFNEDGSPKKGGTAIIVIDNTYAANGAFKDAIIKLLGATVSYYQILIHELLHASDKKRTHGNDGHEAYDIWVDEFEEAVDRVKLEEEKEKMRKRPWNWRMGALPDLFKNPLVAMASIVGVVGCLLVVMGIFFFKGSNLYQLLFPVSEPAQETQETPEVQVAQDPEGVVLTDITFSQVDFYLADDSIGLANSLFGNMTWSYVPDPSTTYYLSVSAALSSNDAPGWIIQNLPLFPAMDGDGAVHREGTLFNLGGLGLTAGTDVSEIYYSWMVHDFILTTGPGAPDTYAQVQTAAHHFCLQGDPVEIDSDFEYFYPEEIHIFGIPLRKNSPRKVSVVQEDDKTCLAGAFARGISWLDQEYGLNFHLTAQDIYEGLRFWGVSDHALWVDDWIAGVRDYTQHQTGNLIEFAAWEQRDIYPSVDGVPETSGPLMEWLGNAFETGVVGLTYQHSKGAHIVTAYDMYTIAGTTFIMYRDDGAQGHYLGDQFVKHSKIYEKDGNYYLGSDGKLITYAIAMLPAPSLVGSIVDHLQPFVLEGKMVYDLNGDGEANDDEPGAAGVEWGVKEKGCEVECEYVVMSQCDEEGYFSAEVDLEENKTYTIEFMEPGWREFAQFMDDFFGVEVYFGNFSAGLPPHPNLTVPWPPMQYSYTDDVGDNEDPDTGELVVNPSGDIIEVVVRINPDNTLQLEITPAAIGGKDEPGALFVKIGDVIWIYHVTHEGDLDAGEFGGSSGGKRPIILPSAGTVRFSGNKWIVTTPLPPRSEGGSLPPGYLNLEITLINKGTIDFQVIIDQLGHIDWWWSEGLDWFSTE